MNEDELQLEASGLKEQIKKARENVNDSNLKKEAVGIPPVEKLGIKMRKHLRGHMSKVYSVDWLSDSKHLLSASQDGYMMIWDGTTTNKLAAIPLKCSWVMTCAYAPDGKLAASGGLDNACSLFNVKSDSGAPTFVKELHGHTAYISSCKILDESKILTGSGDRTCILWDINRPKPVTQFVGHSKGVMSIAMQPGSDNNMFATGSCDSTVKIWDIRTGTCQQSFEYHSRDVNGVAFFPSGQAVGTASEDGTSRLFDLRADQEIMMYDSNLVGNGSEFITCVGFSKSGRLMFTGRWDHCIQVNDTMKGDQLSTIHAHEHLVQCLSVTPNGNAFATGSWDTQIKIWV